MRWTPGGTSGDIEDRRAEGGIRFGGFGGRGLGIGGTLLVLALSVLFRQNLFTGLSNAPSVPYQDDAASGARTAGEQDEVQFVSFVLDDVQHTWDKLLLENGTPY